MIAHGPRISNLLRWRGWRWNDVEMTREGEHSRERSCHEDPFEKQMCLVNESHETKVRPSRSEGCVKTQSAQLEEWFKEKPDPYISNDNFIQDGIFHYWHGNLSGHVRFMILKFGLLPSQGMFGSRQTERILMSLGRMWRQFHDFPDQCIWSRDRSSLYFIWKTAWCSQEKESGQDTVNLIEDRNQYQITDLWWQRNFHGWWCHIHQTEVPYGYTRDTIVKRKGPTRKSISRSHKQTSSESIRSKLDFKIFDEYVYILTDMFSTRVSLTTLGPPRRRRRGLENN